MSYLQKLIVFIIIIIIIIIIITINTNFNKKPSQYKSTSSWTVETVKTSSLVSMIA